MSFKSKNNLDKLKFIRYMRSENEVSDDFFDIKKFLSEKLHPLEIKANDTAELWKVIQYLQKTHTDFLKDDYFKDESARIKFILKHGDPNQRITLLKLDTPDPKYWKKLTQIVKNEDSEAFLELKRLEKLANTDFEE
ncbi:hypothetical protein QTA56_12565 [Acinetobacter sp. VNH17]|uniref:HEAT repeat domain-containing protein n=1 Tax=Acinetobacter thutiue TaxID=2998078 RepID=A0ABT7WQU7_9GAMM|nr:hypothetical protein [Acinetobacter thutiue]MCY6412951.1 hypothetical protein [Acinetobacter thutiue]MDN0015059.1 hypothetical protein [Acinetobacter thutiue]